MFYELVIADFKDLTCLEQNYIGKRPKDFEANGFYCYIIDNTHIFWNQSQKYKKIMMSEKAGTFSKQNGICRRYLFMMGMMYIKFQNYSLCYR